ncbi:MAG: AIR carboxylase family protein [Patescibacteria group bacterium]
MAKVSVILGGKDDELMVIKSGLFKILEEIGVNYEYSIISSDQNPEELRKYCLNVPNTDIEVFICVAGLVPALPGAVKGRLPSHTVIGVPLTSEDYDAKDIMLASFSCPSKRPIIILGVNKMGLKKAAYCAAEILAIKDMHLRKRLENYLKKKTKKPQIRIKEFKSR